MTFLRSLCCAALATAALAGCAVEASQKLPYDELVISEDGAADSFTRKMTFRGALNDSNNSVWADIRENQPVGYLFTGKRGASITIEASIAASPRGDHQELDSVVMLYGPQGPRTTTWSGSRPIASNDDFGDSLNSKLTTRLPADGTYLVVVAEYSGEAGKFSLSLSNSDRILCTSGASACPTGSECKDPYADGSCGPTELCAPACGAIDPTDRCDADRDCETIDTSCCCPHYDAVNGSYAETLSPECSPGTLCPAVVCRETPTPRAVCRANRCQIDDGSECAADSDCPRRVCVRAPCPQQVCRAGECVEPEAECHVDSDCPRRVCVRAPCPQQVCRDNACVEPPPAACVRGGCSSQLCIEEGSGGISTCEWRPEYACYQRATCERQASGACGFTPSAELTACLANPG